MRDEWMRRAVLLLPLLLAGCDSAREAPPPAEETVFDTQVQAQDKAADVQGITDEQAKKLREAVEEAEGG